MKKKCDPPVYMSHHEEPLFLEERGAFNVVLAADLAAGVRALSKVVDGFDGPLEPELLARAGALTLDRDAGTLALRLTRTGRALMGEVAEARFRSLCNALDKEPVIA